VSRLSRGFEANLGQTDPAVQFLARSPRYTLFLTPDEAVLSLHRPASPQGATDDANAPADAVVRLQLVDSNPDPVPVGVDELPGKSNYFRGEDPAQWRTDIPRFRAVRYSDVYPGIDLVYHDNGPELEYDFVVAPGVDPSSIRLRFAGVDVAQVNAAGELVLQIGREQLRQPRPVVYQDTDHGRVEVLGQYVLGRPAEDPPDATGVCEVHFAVGAYDPSRPLVIDPTLVYSTYLGGSGDLDRGLAIAADSAGNAYITGSVGSTNFPTAGPIQPTNAGSTDAFVTKLNTAGTALVYSTYLGGAGADFGTGIAVDGAGNVYVAGSTTSSNFPTVAALQPAHGGGFRDAFVAKLNPAGNALIYATYLGGSQDDEAAAIACDTAGNAYVTGYTASANFPTQNALQPTFGGGPPGSATDVFLAKLNAGGSALVYSTYLGGNGQDLGRGIAVDSAGNAYVTGATSSTNFPTASPIQAANAGATDAFVAKLNAAGSALVYSTYLGGSGTDVAFELAVDASGQAFVAGSTASSNFPTANPLQAANAGGTDAFVAKLNAAGSALFYSTYLGGSNNDEARGIALDGTGLAYIVGFTSSTNFPTVNPLQPTHGAGVDNAFVAKIANPGLCDPRPAVALGVQPESAGRLRVDVVAQTSLGTPTNALSSLRFGPATNALVDVPGGPTGSTGNFPLSLPPGTQQTTFFVRRATASGSATVPLVAVDRCGDWSTFVGGGASAFPPAPPPPGAPAAALPAPSAGPTPSGSPATPAAAAPPSCAPRPSVSMTTAPTSPGRLQVTVAAAPAHTLQSLRFGPLTNASLDLPGGPTSAPGDRLVPLPPGTRQTGFIVQRTSPGQPVTVPLVVVDDCGEWSTVVGGGPAAF
jgi:hypothetical protein